MAQQTKQQQALTYAANVAAFMAQLKLLFNGIARF